MQKIFYSLSAAVALAACTSSPETSIPTIDLVDNLSQENVGSLDSLFEVTALIQPQVTDSTMLSYPALCGQRNDSLYLAQDNRLMIFDLASGECQSSFDHTGQGPEEYILMAFAAPSADGAWTGLDLRGKRLMRYSADGRFGGAWAAPKLSRMVADGAGWVGEKEAHGEGVKTFYFYDGDMSLTDSLVTRFPLTDYRATLLFPFDGRAALLEDDTVFVFTPDHTLEAKVALNTGNLKMPNFDNFEQALAERNKYLTYNVMMSDDFMNVSFSYDGRYGFQVYNLSDGRLIYSRIFGRDEMKGIPVTVDGRELPMMPGGLHTADSFYGLIPGEMLGDGEDDGEDNIGIVRLRLRD